MPLRRMSLLTPVAVPRYYSVYRFIYKFVNIVIFRCCTHYMFRLKYALNLKADY
jgi:hypothetical protein